MNSTELEKLLAHITRIRIAVLGDFALDLYWFIDPSASELSLETSKPTQPVARHVIALGGAGNVVRNLADLGLASIHALGVVGPDPFGREMLRLLQAGGAHIEHVLTQHQAWHTVAFGKPILHGVEQSRLDFGHFNTPSAETTRALISRLQSILSSVDAIVINQQVRQGLHSPQFRRQLAAFMARHRDRLFLVDSRDYSDSYPHAILKVNEREALRLSGQPHPHGQPIPDDAVIRAAQHLFGARNRPVFITRGERGCIVCDTHECHIVPPVPVAPPIDPVGAGDSFLAGIVAALAAGRSPLHAARFGSLVAAVTIKKLFQTGTATPEEILQTASQGNAAGKTRPAGQ